MSAVVSLARALCSLEGLDPDAYDPEDEARWQNWRMWQSQAERIIDNPGPVLDAFAEADLITPEAKP